MVNERLARLCTNTTCHGVPDWYSSKQKIPKLFWTLVLLTAFSAIVYYQYNLVINFLATPTATKISKNVVDYLAFPNVTVCNQNAYSMARLNGLWPQLQTIFATNGLTTPTSPTDLLETIRWTTVTTPTISSVQSAAVKNLAYQESQILFNKSLNAGVTQKFDRISFLQQIGYGCSDIFVLQNDCLFGMAGFNCCANADSPILTQFGNCYKVSPTHIDTTVAPFVTQVQPGINSGLEITMTYSRSDSPSFNAMGERTEGFYLSIGDYMTSLDSSAITVGPSMYVSINLALNMYVYDPTINTCTDQSSPLQYTSNGVTSVQLCKQECQVKMNFRFCGCSPIYPNSAIPPALICDTPQIFGCFMGKTQMFYNTTYREAVMNCQYYECPKLCNTKVYVPFAVYSKIAPENRMGDTRYTTAVANVFFGELAYTLIVEKPLMDLAGLISGFGGNLGLFAGMSLITIVQCLATFVGVGYDGVVNWHNRRNGRIGPPSKADFVQPVYIA